MTGFFTVNLDFSGIHTVKENCIHRPKHLSLGINFFPNTEEKFIDPYGKPRYQRKLKHL